jgi:hypothetical protein
MDHARHGHRSQWIALAAAAGLCAALAGCTSSEPSGPGTTVTSAPNGPGDWSSAQKTSAQTALEGPPMSQSPAQAACLVRYASETTSWQEFQSYLAFLAENNATATPTSLASISNHYTNTCARLTGTFGPVTPTATPSPVTPPATPTPAV